jgi:hypothetical protein
MTDASWDNQGMDQPPRSGLPVWAKILLGCGVAALLLGGACVGGTYWLAQKAKRDPEGFKRGALGFALSQIRPDYDFAAAVVRQLQDDAGCRALWQAHPGIHAAFGTEQAFLQAVEGWRPHLAELAALDVNDLEKGRFDLQKDPFAGVRFSYRMPDGSRLRMQWSGSDRRLSLLDLKPAERVTVPGEDKP